MWRSSHWLLNTAAFSNQPISSWVLAILKPYHLLAITRQKTHRFQLFAAATLDHIWFSRNSPVHNAVQPEPSKSIEQVLPLRISPSQLGNFLDEFEVLQSVFSIQKVYLKKERKKYTFGKKKN